MQDVNRQTIDLQLDVVWNPPDLAARIKTDSITIRLTAEQRRAIEQRAEQCGLRVAVWMRTILVQAATRPATDGRIHLKEPDGTLV